jgi:hypothetical protein
MTFLSSLHTLFRLLNEILSGMSQKEVTVITLVRDFGQEPRPEGTVRAKKEREQRLPLVVGGLDGFLEVHFAHASHATHAERTGGLNRILQPDPGAAFMSLIDDDLPAIR